MPTAVNITTASSTSGATMVLTTGVAVPVGATIVVAVCDASTSGSPGSMTDSGGNVYTSQRSALLNNAAASGFAAIYTAPVKTALTTSSTITFTKGVTGSVACMSACYANGTTGQTDAPVANSATGSSTAPSVTTAAAPHTNTLLFAMAGYGNSGTYTQTGSWTTPFTAITSSTTRGLGGGNQQQNSNATIAFSPTLGTTGVWAALVIGLQAVLAGSGQQDSDEAQPLYAPIRKRLGRARGRSEFAFFSHWKNAGWEVQPFQPPHIAKEKRGAVMPKEDGTEAVFVTIPPPPPFGWFVQPWQPPHFYREKRGTGIKGKSEFAFFSQWFNWGWDVQPPPPPHQFRERRTGAFTFLEAGIELPYLQWLNTGWEQTYSWPIKQTPYTKPSILEIGDQGIAGPITPPVITVPLLGWEQVHVQPLHKFWKLIFINDDDASKPVFQNWINAGWEQTFSWPIKQTPYTNPKILEVGDITGLPTFQQWQNLGFGAQEWQPPHKWFRGHGLKGDDGFYTPFPWLNTGWEIQPWQPPHRWFRGHGLRGNDGTELPFAQWLNLGWDEIFAQPIHKFFKSPDIGDQGIASTFTQWLNAGGLTDAIAPHRRFKSPDVGDVGTELPLIFIVPTPTWDFQETFSQPPHRWWKSPEIGDQGIVLPFRQWLNTGWEIQPPPPPHLWRRGQGLIGDDAIWLPFSQWFNFGFEQTATQPLHRFFKSPDIGDVGNEAPYIFIPPGFVFWPWDQISSQDPRRRWEKSAALMRGDDGSEAPFTQWFNFGFEQAFAQPVHKWLRGQWFRGDDGIVSPFIFWTNFGWEQTASQPLHKLWKSPDIGDVGNEAPYIFIPPGFVAWPFDPTFSQEPRRRWEKTAAIFRGDDGSEAQFIPWNNFGWEVQHPQPPHHWYRGQGLRGDDGTEALYAFWNNLGWEVQPHQPQHLWRRGQGLIGDDAIWSPFTQWLNAGGLTDAIAPHRRFNSPDIGDQGIAGPFTQWRNFGWEPQLPPPPHRLFRGHTLKGDDGTSYVFYNWINGGWEVIPPQPPHPRREVRGAILRGDDGAEGLFTQWLFSGWEQTQSQPKHPWLRSPDIGDTGTEAVYIFVPPVQVPLTIFDFVQSWQPPVSWRNAKSYSALKGKAEFAAWGWYNAGWEVQPWQPPRARWERRGAFLRGDEGNQAPFVFWRFAGWEVQPFQPPRARWERRGNILIGDPGNEARYFFWRNFGWEVQPPQPPRWPNTRRGAILKGEDGTEAVYVFVPPPPTPPLSEQQFAQWRSPASIARRAAAFTGLEPFPVFPFIPPIIPPIIPTFPPPLGVLTIDPVQGYILGNEPVINQPWSLIFRVGGGLTSGPVLFTFTRPDGTIQLGNPIQAFIGPPTIAQIHIGNQTGGEYLVYHFLPNELSQLGTWTVSAITANFFSNTYSFNVLPSRRDV